MPYNWQDPISGAASGAAIGGPWGAGIGAAAGGIAGFFDKNKLNVSDINKRFLADLPEGLTQGDRDFAENQRSRGVAANRSLYNDARANVVRRAATRGTSASPATEGNLAKLNEREGAGIERAGERATSLLGGIRNTREAARRSGIFRAWDKEVGAQTRNFDADAEQQAGFWDQMGSLARAYASRNNPAGRTSTTEPYHVTADYNGPDFGGSDTGGPR